MVSSRWWGVPFAVLALTASYAPGPLTNGLALAAPRASTVAPGCYGGQLFDFNDDGHTDVAVGEPRGPSGSVRDAGSVEVRYGCGALPPQQLRLKHPHRGDRFGAALAQGYYDDGNASYRVLFVGVPYLDVDGHDNAGGVAEFHSSATGLTLFRVLTQASRGVPGKVQGGAHFGAALSLSDDNEEAFALRIGEPGKNVGHAKDTGGYVTLHFDDDPDQPDPGATETTIADFGVKAQDGDLLGSSFSVGDTDRIGAPGRTVDGHRGAGAVLESAEPRLVDQDTPGVPGTPGTDDHFGATLSGSWIGVPGETVGSAKGAGVVQFWDPSDPSSSTTVSQDTAGIPGSVGTDHGFGAALAYDDAFEVSGGPDVDDLFVGAPGDRSGVGSVTMLRLPSGGPAIGSAVSLPGADQSGGGFGTSVAVSGVDRVLVGAPGAAGGRVFSYRLPADPSAAPILGVSWTRDSGVGTGYGTTLPGPFVDE